MVAAKKAPSGGEAPAPPTSFVAFEYDGEVYSVKEHRSALQAFGIYSKDIYKRTAIIITLPMNETIGTTIDRTRSATRTRGRRFVHAWADWFAQPGTSPTSSVSAGRAPAGAARERALREDPQREVRRAAAPDVPRLREGARSTMSPIFQKKTKKRGPIVNPGETHRGGRPSVSAPTPNAGPARRQRQGVKYEAAADIPQVVTDDSAYEKGGRGGDLEPFDATRLSSTRSTRS